MVRCLYVLSLCFIYILIINNDISIFVIRCLGSFFKVFSKSVDIDVKTTFKLIISIFLLYFYNYCVLLPLTTKYYFFFCSSQNIAYPGLSFKTKLLPWFLMWPCHGSH